MDSKKKEHIKNLSTDELKKYRDRVSSEFRFRDVEVRELVLTIQHIDDELTNRYMSAWRVA